ncbi:putative General secretion pathway protein E (Type II traffic warden ATPase) [Bradyrhizobium sp. ORS 278]|uniref:GspE/PulE family protein n=1 Tax=Bradyrhizobium sp. (strain ORS 278) TaxID=114615 RepID=UPI0001507E3F|nr:ATPase, T2SS/T4P/T4SS family [Bradyrhizobium sp. ORS 278]CAL75192.1 putative General secretion pathway protein E (Type II traffic warden ATPase) [Bradyrhizobium sp. ORS 278]
MSSTSPFRLADEDGEVRSSQGADPESPDFADAIARQLGLPRIGLAGLLAAKPLTEQFSRRFLRETAVFPFQSADREPCLAVADPRDSATARAAELVFGGPVALVVASAEDIGTALNQLVGDDDAPARSETGEPQLREDDIESLRDLATGAPVVRAVNDLFEQAVELRASDIHVEAMRSGLSIRMRVDGLLKPVAGPSGVLPRAVISRIKIVAGLNIAERRLPQDGAARLRVGRHELDVRVAVMPTQHGESAVIRLLPKDRGLLSIEKLGFAPHDDRTLRRLLALPHGMIVICGPTGSGKTTTLATALSILNEPTRKILTIEDPVEYEIPGINQSQVKPAVGLTFASALRSFVRQDPDVIMVGEVRDSETAHVAVHAALTGHLVLTTLHTENAAAAVPRLLDLGVEDFLLRSTLRAVIAQRLVRKLCVRCRSSHLLSADDLSADPRYAAVGFDVGETVYMPAGCESCGGTGYRGRLGIFEVLELDQDIRSLIQGTTDAAMIDRSAIRNGMTTMLDDGVAKCRAGATSVAEVLRVTTLR